MGLNNTENKQASRVALYCRIASGSPIDADSIYLQRDALRTFAESQGLIVQKEYLDCGYSGLSLDRPMFTQMEADIDAGIIDTIVVRGIDRIARSYQLVSEWLVSLQARGVKLIASDDSHGSLMLLPESN